VGATAGPHLDGDDVAARVAVLLDEHGLVGRLVLRYVGLRKGVQSG